MNAAAKEISQANFFTGQLAEMRFSKPFLVQFILLTAVLVSALSVIYTTNLYRVTFSQLQSLDQQANQLQLQWGQLLLEHASLASPARVQAMAVEKLHMVLPANKQAHVLRLR